MNVKLLELVMIDTVSEGCNATFKLLQLVMNATVSDGCYAGYQIRVSVGYAGIKLLQLV